MSDDLQTVPAPKPGQRGTRNTARRTRVVSTRHAARPIKGLTQLNVKVRARIKERFEAAFAQVDGEMTKGELLEAMIDAYLAGSRPKPEVQPKVPPEDARDGRTVALTVYATPELADALSARAARHRWTLSGTIERACAVAQEAEGAG